MSALRKILEDQKTKSMNSPIEWRVRPSMAPLGAGMGYLGGSHVATVSPQFNMRDGSRWDVTVYLGHASERRSRSCRNPEHGMDLAGQLVAEWLAKAGLAVQA